MEEPPASRVETETAMAEPGRETDATPPALPPPAAVAEPTLETSSAFQDTPSSTATLDSAQPKAESAHQPLPSPQVTTTAVGAPEQTTADADGEPPAATLPPKVAALTPAAEAPGGDKQPVSGLEDDTQPTPGPWDMLLPPATVADPTLETSSAIQDTPSRTATLDSAHQRLPSPQETTTAVGAPEQTTADADGEPPAATLPPKVAALTPPAEAPGGDKQPVSRLEEDTKPTPGPGEMALPPPQKDSGSAVRVPSNPEAGKGEGETKPAAPGQEQVATLPPPTETSSQERTATATTTTAPAPLQPPRKQEGGGGALEQASSAQDKKDAAAAPAAAAARRQEGEEKQKPARRRWRRLQALVGLLFLRPTGGETKPPTLPVDKAAVEKGEGETKPPAQDDKKPASGQKEQKPAAAKKPSRKHSAGAARKGKDEGEGSKGRRDEAEARSGSGKTTSQTQLGLEGEQEHPSRKNFRMAGRLVQWLMSSYNKHRRPQDEKKDGKHQQHRNWPREEMRLEHILEEAFTWLLATEYNKELSRVRQKCLLTFSVFDLAAEVKKQAMIYWWVAEFNLRHRSDRDPPPPPAARAPGGGGGGSSASPPVSPAPQGKGKGADADSSSRDDDADAEGIFFRLSDHGFLVPMKNWCTKAIHGCQVNPLVHWMLKRQARGDCVAELDGKGSPKDLQLSSGILCLTSGNRRVMQTMRMKDEPQPQAKTKKDESQQSQAGKERKVTKETSLKDKGEGDHVVQDQEQQPTTTGEEAKVGSKSMAVADKAPSQKDEDPTQAKDQLTKGTKNIQHSSEPAEHLDENIPPELFEGKQVIFNVNAHVYPISKSAFVHLAECLVVLQLGRWNNLDDNTYMEVDGLDTRDAIGLLKNLRYLGLRGLSRLTVLPKGIENLKKLVILDMRGCQNLVKVAASVITQLRQLTHLDLTQCYMLEHIGRGITSLTELQVFKGFVFATGTQWSKACRIQDLKRLKKLQKLTVSITTDANVGRGEMAELKNLTSLRKLTITWSEIPSILEGEMDKVKKKREDLVERWTSFQLPKDLIKLDIRCYPKEELVLEKHTKLEKLYLRGGDMERFSTKKSNTIKTLRLRYLQNFKMGWNEIRSELKKVEYVEIVVNKDATQEKDTSEVKKDTEDTKVKSIKSAMKMPDFKVPDFTLDGHGVWTKDQKEEDYYKQKLDAPNKDAMGENKASGPSEPTEDSSTKDASANHKR